MLVTIEKWLDALTSANDKAYVECFAENAIVHDEGLTHRGRNEIEQWKKATTEKYQPQYKLLGYEEKGDIIHVMLEVSGTFPGSPLPLGFHLRLKDGLIQELKIG